MKDGFLKAAALSPSLRVADCNYNASQIVSQLQDAAARGVKLAVFPEFCLTGYTCGDLFLQRTLQQGALDALQTVLDASRELDVVALVGLPLLVRGKLYNCAAVLCKGQLPVRGFPGVAVPPVFPVALHVDLHELWKRKPPQGFCNQQHYSASPRMDFVA